jgi:hypothetical protein
MRNSQELWAGFLIDHAATSCLLSPGALPARRPGALVALVRGRTVAKVDSLAV